MSNNKSNPVMNVRLASELDHAFERNGYSAELVKKLLTGDLLSKLLPAVQGHADVVMKKHIIDLVADPFVPSGWKVEEHIKTEAQIEFDPTKIELYLSESQKQGKLIKGHDLRKELEGKPVLIANVLDYLLAHPEIIPNSWKDKYIFFWGTIYRGSGGSLWVRCLGWGGGEWLWRYYWLGDDFSGASPTALLASI
ncbi:MAG: hypothetical protein ABH884_02055 [Candidatus Komeilibacteria bacterium]